MTSKKLPKILVGTPTCSLYEYCLKEYAESVNSFTYPDYDILIVDNTQDDNYLKKIKAFGLPATKGPYLKGARDRIIASRNLLREYAINQGYDYLLSLEQDVIPPRDVIEKLLEVNQKISSALYFNLNNQYEFPNLVPGTIELPLAYKLFSKDEQKKPFKDQLLRKLTKEEVLTKKKILVRMTGLGCMLIHKDVLNKIPFDYYREFLSSDDRHFCDKAAENNIPIVVDTSIICTHLTAKRPFDWSNIEK
ncbi:MAG TPA: glycosyltransferase [Candidatus Nanoarchaeia archaeon]|nr:glycosyltransferase [Candidatus Nanoarchaeia archaeon]